MKTILKSMTCIAIGAMMAEPAAAQQKDNYPELEGPGPVIIISKDKNGKQELIDVFNETQRPHFHDPRAPRFLLTDRQGKFALGIGGYLKTTMEYDFDGTVDDIDFIPALIPQPGSTQVRNQFQMDAGTSTIFLKLVGRTKHLGNFIVYTAGWHDFLSCHPVALRGQSDEGAESGRGCGNAFRRRYACQGCKNQ